MYNLHLNTLHTIGFNINLKLIDVQSTFFISFDIKPIGVQSKIFISFSIGASTNLMREMNPGRTSIRR